MSKIMFGLTTISERHPTNEELLKNISSLYKQATSSEDIFEHRKCLFGGFDRTPLHFVSVSNNVRLSKQLEKYMTYVMRKEWGTVYTDVDTMYLNWMKQIPLVFGSLAKLYHLNSEHNYYPYSWFNTAILLDTTAVDLKRRLFAEQLI